MCSFSPVTENDGQVFPFPGMTRHKGGFYHSTLSRPSLGSGYLSSSKVTENVWKKNKVTLQKTFERKQNSFWKRGGDQN
jgi:hypothetical protein